MVKSSGPGDTVPLIIKVFSLHENEKSKFLKNNYTTVLQVVNELFSQFVTYADEIVRVSLKIAVQNNFHGMRLELLLENIATF